MAIIATIEAKTAAAAADDGDHDNGDHRGFGHQHHEKHNFATLDMRRIFALPHLHIRAAGSEKSMSHRSGSK